MAVLFEGQNSRRTKAHYVVGELGGHVALCRPVAGPSEQVALAAVPSNC